MFRLSQGWANTSNTSPLQINANNYHLPTFTSFSQHLRNYTYTSQSVFKCTYIFSKYFPCSQKIFLILISNFAYTLSNFGFILLRIFVIIPVTFFTHYFLLLFHHMYTCRYGYLVILGKGLNSLEAEA